MLATSTTERCAVVWAKKTSATFGKLSTNVVHEIVLFLLEPQPLVYIKPNSVNWYDWEAGWRTLFLTSRRICVDQGSSGACLRAKVFFACGSSACFTGTGGREAYLLDNGEVVEYPKMRLGRCFHGLVYDHLTNYIFVFGGKSHIGDPGDSIAHCEALSLNEYSWRELPKMQAARKRFCPVLFQRDIYLCGGGPAVVERFYIQRNVFSVCSFGVPADFDSVVAAREKHTLFILGHSAMCILDLFTEQITIERRTHSANLRAQCASVIRAGVIYWEDFHGVFAVPCYQQSI